MSSATALNPKKRTFDAAGVGDDHNNNEPTEQEVAAMSRSERKRHREKKRRSDVNKGFDELMSLLLEIDPEVRADAEERASKGQCKRSLGAHEENVLSRVDLIATAIKVLKRVHGENEKHKKVIEDLLKSKNDPTSAIPRPSAAAAAAALAAHGAGSATGPMSDLSALATSSFVDRNSLLQKSAALGLGNAAAGGTPATTQAWESAAQLRAKANLLGNMPSAAAGASSLRDYSTAELLALRASSAQNAGRTASAGGEAALLSQMNANAKAALMQRSLLVQNMLNNPTGNLMSAESLYGALQSSSSHADQSSAPKSNLIAENLYGALGGGESALGRGTLQMQKEEELRKLRAAGHQL